MKNRTLPALFLLSASLGLFGCSAGSETSQGTQPGDDVSIEPAGPLSVQEITPSSGSVLGETVALIRGTGFVPGMRVLFGEERSQQVQFVNESLITALVPTHPPGTVHVKVLDPTRDHDAAQGGNFTFFEHVPDDGLDSDGDGLTDVEEQVVGYRIKVDMLGLGLHPDHLIEYSVNSDPFDPDTDDDGLNDLEEFLAKTNPRDHDTDGDLLWDAEEAKRWLTSPISVDSDGDARDADPSTVHSTLPPVFDLFDGLELYTADQLALPPSQRGAIKLNATSPTLADTDGDNVSDFDEIDTPVRTPILADMPQLVFEIVDDLDVRLDIEYAEEEGVTTAIEATVATSTGTSLTESQSNTVSTSMTVGADVSVGFEGAVPAGSTSAHWETTAGYEESWSEDRERSASREEAYSELLENSRTKTEVAATGSITTGIRIRNAGNISVQVTDLSYTMRQWQANQDNFTDPELAGEFFTLASLAPDLGPGLTLAPGTNSGVLLASAEGVNVDRVKAFLQQPYSLQIEPAAYELANSDGFNFAFIEEVTGSRTARVSVDFGNGEFEEYRIATNVDRNPDGSYAGITMDRVMDTLFGPDEWEMQFVPSLCEKEEAFTLTRVRDVAAGASPFADLWLVSTTDEEEQVAKPFDEIVLRNGQSLLLSYIKDEDGDGLWAPVEQHLGSSDLALDTDGDGVADPIEAVREVFIPCFTTDGGWNVNVSIGGSNYEYRAYSDPTKVDSDGDGWTDFEEEAAKTDPMKPDTDEDGLPDPTDPFPTHQAKTLYVMEDAPSGGTGLSWDEALNDLEQALQMARDAANDGSFNNDISAIWVAAGEYVVGNEGGADRVTVYGGFSGDGTETSLGQRVPQGLVNGTSITPADPSESILFSSQDLTYFGLDGFTIRDCQRPAIRWNAANPNVETDIEIANCFFINNLDDENYGNESGGAALHLTGVNLTLRDTIFADNRTEYGASDEVEGGAVYLSGGNHEITSCTFTRNQIVLDAFFDGQQFVVSEGGDGGALHVDNSTCLIESTLFVNNEIVDATALGAEHARGGAVNLQKGDYILRDCTFRSNAIDQSAAPYRESSWDMKRAGGALVVGEWDGTSNVSVLGCVFVDNRAACFGGAFWCEATEARIVNTTFAENVAYPDHPDSLAYFETAVLDATGQALDDWDLQLPLGEYYECAAAGSQTGATLEGVSVGAGLGVSKGQAYVDNCLFWKNYSLSKTSMFVSGSGAGPSVVFTYGASRQLATPPHFQVPDLDDWGFSIDFGNCFAGGGSLTYSNCALPPTTPYSPGAGSGSFVEAFDRFPGTTEAFANFVLYDDAGFQNPDARDFRLRESSPLIDAGNNFVDTLFGSSFELLPERDIDGLQRLVDGNGDGQAVVDIGAFEFQVEEGL